MFLFFVLLAHRFGSDSFGEFAYYFSIASIIFVLFDIGGEFYQIREFTKKESLKVFQNIFIFKTAVALPVLLITFLSGQSLFLLVLLSSYYLDSIISIFRSSFYRNGFYSEDALLIIVEKAVFIALVLFNVFMLNNILVMYLAFLAAKFVYLLVALNKYYSLRYLFSSFRLYDSRFFRYYAMNSWSYVLHALLVVVFVQIDVVMLKQMGISFDRIGLYSAAVKIYMTIVVIAEILFKQYYPKVSVYIHRKDTDGLRHLILKVQSLNIYASIVFAFVTMLFAHDIINLSFGSDFAEAARMLVMFSIVIVFRFSMCTYTALLSSSELNYMKLVTSLTCVVINICLNYLLIPQYGVYGALVATMVTEFILVTLYKMSSLRIVFTNILTAGEILAVSFVVAGSYFFTNYSLATSIKVTFAVAIGVALVVNKKKLKNAFLFDKAA